MGWGGIVTFPGAPSGCSCPGREGSPFWLHCPPWRSLCVIQLSGHDPSVGVSLIVNYKISLFYTGDILIDQVALIGALRPTSVFLFLGNLPRMNVLTGGSRNVLVFIAEDKT